MLACVSGKRVAITDMPQMVALYNGMGGGSAAAIGAVELLRYSAAGERPVLDWLTASAGYSYNKTDRYSSRREFRFVSSNLPGDFAFFQPAHLLSDAIIDFGESEELAELARDLKLELARIYREGPSGPGQSGLLLARDGREIPIDDSAAPIKDGQKVRGVILVFSNVSERKAAERSRREAEIMQRIVEAQESERRRIARDLHDVVAHHMSMVVVSAQTGGQVRQQAARIMNLQSIQSIKML